MCVGSEPSVLRPNKQLLHSWNFLLRSESAVYTHSLSLHTLSLLHNLSPDIWTCTLLFIIIKLKPQQTGPYIWMSSVYHWFDGDLWPLCLQETSSTSCCSTSSSRGSPMCSTRQRTSLGTRSTLCLRAPSGTWSSKVSLPPSDRLLCSITLNQNQNQL